WSDGSISERNIGTPHTGHRSCPAGGVGSKMMGCCIHTPRLIKAGGQPVSRPPGRLGTEAVAGQTGGNMAGGRAKKGGARTAPAKAAKGKKKGKGRKEKFGAHHPRTLVRASPTQSRADFVVAFMTNYLAQQPMAHCLSAHFELEGMARPRRSKTHSNRPLWA